MILDLRLPMRRVRSPQVLDCGLGCALRNQPKGFSLIESVRRKSTAIQGKNQVGLQLFAQGDQSGIGKIHGDVSILFHQERNALKAFWGRRNQLKGSSQDKLKGIFLSLPGRSDQVERLGEYRFGGYNGPAPLFQGGDAVGVHLLASVHESDERAGIQQKLILHGADGGSGSRGAVALSRVGRFQHFRVDRERARWVGSPVGYSDTAPKPRAPLRIACVLAVSLTALICWQDPPAIASLIAVPYGASPSALHCNATTCKEQSKLEQADRLHDPANVFI